MDNYIAVSVCQSVYFGPASLNDIVNEMAEDEVDPNDFNFLKVTPVKVEVEVKYFAKVISKEKKK